MVTRRTGRVSAIRGRVVLVSAGLALGLGTAVTGVAQGALTAGSVGHLSLDDVGWNSPKPHVAAGDIGWNAAPNGDGDDVGWN